MKIKIKDNRCPHQWEVMKNVPSHIDKRICIICKKTKELIKRRKGER
jgi:hypothetical protein